MKLSNSDVDEFYGLYILLLEYTNDVLAIADIADDNFTNLPLEKKIEIRNALYDNDLFSNFIEENPYGFTEKQLDIIREWQQKHLRGRFIIVRYLKKYTVFLDQEKEVAYGVYSLSEPLEKILKVKPIMVETVLLPFKNRIVYDGLLHVFPVFFGSGIRRNIEDSYRKAKMKGILESLDEKPKELDEKDMLIFYLNSKEREFYRKEIDRLKQKYPEVYFREAGKIESRKLKRKLKMLGAKGWFAVLEDVVVASGETREEVEKIVEKVLTGKSHLVYVFKV